MAGNFFEITALLKKKVVFSLYLLILVRSCNQSCVAGKSLFSIEKSHVNPLRPLSPVGSYVLLKSMVPESSLQRPSGNVWNTRTLA